MDAAASGAQERPPCSLRELLYLLRCNEPGRSQRVHAPESEGPYLFQSSHRLVLGARIPPGSQVVSKASLSRSRHRPDH